MNTLKFEEDIYTKQIEERRCGGPETAILYNNRGHTRYLLVEFDAAVEDYNEAIRRNPKLAVAYYNRGTVLYRLGQFPEALSDMNKATSLEPLNPEFRQGLEECRKAMNHTSNT
ncbi:tetratricopeptide repeat protein 32 [Anabrus simplex]|uniref:tetratricopeptide repeat protein 32 n=1 Tax=Anabrus simplex TaxID=316456 RepID=UPI0034DD8C33